MLKKVNYINAGLAHYRRQGKPKAKEKQGMHCYQYLAATVAVANIIERIPGIHHKLPLCLIADWMTENEIEAEDVFFATPGDIEVRIVDLVHRNQPRIQQAA